MADAPEFPRKSAATVDAERGAIAPLSPSEAGPLLAPWIPPKQQSDGAGAGVGKPLTVSWTGAIPAAVGPVAVWEVPYNPDGSPITFKLKRAMLRIETVGTGTLTATMEKASGGDVAFGSATTEASLSIAAGHFQSSSALSSGTISSGELIRLNFTALGGAAGVNYSATLVGST